jgi:DNA-binding MarR family transcriptional regulator
MRHASRAALDADVPPALGEVLDFLRLIWSVDHELLRASRRMERTLGITALQRLVIRIIGRFPLISAGHLARLLSVHPGTLTGIVNRLERRGLVRRHADPRDRRRSLLGLTMSGRRFDVVTEGTVESTLHDVLRSTTPRRVAAVREVLEALAATLRKTAAENPAGARENQAARGARDR